jgi:hypothetical protein
VPVNPLSGLASRRGVSLVFPRMIRFHRRLVWLAVSLLGAASVAVAAFQRDEPVNALWLVVAGVCTFAVAYRFHSAWLMAKVLTIDDRRAPAAVTCSDGKDFVPTPKWVVFGHHFTAIAGPEPLLGPVLAAFIVILAQPLQILAVKSGLGGAKLAAAKTSLFNARLEVGITVVFLLLVSVIVAGTAHECWLLPTQRKMSKLRESEYATHSPAYLETLPTSLL